MIEDFVQKKIASLLEQFIEVITDGLSSKS